MTLPWEALRRFSDVAVYETEAEATEPPLEELASGMQGESANDCTDGN